jgi:putative endonuclease
MPWTRHHLGLRGERVAARHLRRLGYTIVRKNFRSRRGEIDLIALDGDVLVFVEVRTRSPGGLATPVETVAGPKRLRLLRAAIDFVRELASYDRAMRFDVVGVRPRGWGRWEVEVFRNAFEAPAGYWI